MPRLSHSAVEKYMTCPRSYKHAYVDKLREKTTTSALAFGSAIDQALNAMLEDKKDTGSIGPIEKYLKAFDESWTNGEINKKKVHLPDCTLLGYNEKEFDFSLLNDEAIRFLTAKAQELVPAEFAELGLEETIYKCQTYKSQKAFRQLKDNELKMLNLASWFSMREKGHLMVRQYAKDVIPKIKKVLEVQKLISTDNNDGDAAVGYIDAILEWETGDVYLVDNKTSSRLYEEDAVIRSQQLGFYSAMTGIKKGMFIVMQKNIRQDKARVCQSCGYVPDNARAKTCTNEASGKRCGGAWTETVSRSIQINFVMDTIPDSTSDGVFETFDDVNKAIRANIFPKNLKACSQGWGRCPYYNLCHKGDGSDLEQT